MSLQGDRVLLKELAKRYNTTVSDRVYSDKGKSAYNGVHLKNELGHLLSDIDNKQIKAGDIIVVRQLDRLSRMSLMNALDLYMKIMKAGVKIHTTMDNRLYVPNDEVSVILATLSFNTANEESVKKSYLTNKHALARIEQFIAGERINGNSIDIGVGHHPFYIQLKDKEVSKHPKLFKAMREVVGLSLQQKGLGYCVKFLAEKYDHKITTAGLADSLKSPALFGQLSVTIEDKAATKKHSESGLPQKITKTFKLDDYYPAICTKTEYFKMAALKKKQTHNNGLRKHYSLLAGGKFLHCGCGSPMSILHSSNKGSQKSGKYYSCISSKCNTLIPCYTLDNIVLTELAGHLFFHDSSNNDEILALQEELKSKTKNYNSLQDLIFENAELFNEHAKKKLLSSKQEIIEIESKIASEQAKQIEVDSFNDISLDTYRLTQAKIESILLANSEIKKDYHYKIKLALQDIVYSNDGLVTITFIDGKKVYIYTPTDYRKHSGLRFGIKLIIEDHQTKVDIIKEIEHMRFKIFTEDDIENKKYINSLSDIPQMFLTQYSPKSTRKTGLENFRDQISSHISEHGFIVWRNRSVKAIGLSDKQWRTYCNRHHHKNIFKFCEVTYETQKGNSTVATVAYSDKMPTKAKVISSLPYSPKKVLQIKSR